MPSLSTFTPRQYPPEFDQHHSTHVHLSSPRGPAFTDRLASESRWAALFAAVCNLPQSATPWLSSKNFDQTQGQYRSGVQPFVERQQDLRLDEESYFCIFLLIASALRAWLTASPVWVTPSVTKGLKCSKLRAT